MEARRVSANPRPSCVRRVIARKRPRPEATANSARKLQRREISELPGRTFAVSTTRERFRNIQLQEEFDTHDPKENGSLLPYLRKRSEIIEIVGARDIIFALSQSGVCAAFSRVTNQRSCFLNGSPDGVIRSLCALRCRTTRIEYIWRAKPDAGFPLLEIESLKWPGFVEFDDVNGKVLTYSAQDRGQCLFYKYQRDINRKMLGQNKGREPLQAKEGIKVPNYTFRALGDITALYYDEERDEIYTGNRQGLVHVWSN